MNLGVGGQYKMGLGVLKPKFGCKDPWHQRDSELHRQGDLFSGYFGSGWDRRRASSMRVTCVAVASSASAALSEHTRA
jgi:hypothetical protein